jgi:spoIIIJ-associated protein
VNEVNDKTPSIEQTANQALELVSGFIQKANLNATATIADAQPDIVNIDINGSDSSGLIGRRGQVLDALQYLVLVMLTHNKPNSNHLRIHLDADGYRKRRESSLKLLAQSLAAQVKSTGEEAVLEPLNALERRIVHTELVDDHEVETYSEGVDPYRHVVITPRRSKPE